MVYPSYQWFGFPENRGQTAGSTLPSKLKGKKPKSNSISRLIPMVIKR